MYYGKNVGVVPLTDAAGITKPFAWPSHKGVDIGWYATQYCPVLAWQDGVVVQKGYGGEVGYYIVVEHTYSDSKRWTGYIHLAYSPTVNVGDKVTLGKQMGNATRGNTGVSNGVHLHLYLTKAVSLDTKYTWDTMLANSIDPVPYLYWSKDFNTAFISTAWKNELKKIVYPTPVERNIKVHQVEVKSDTRRMRQTPSLSGQAYDEYCTKGIYNVLDMTFMDEYTWAKIGAIDGNNFWVAVMSGEDLPAKIYVYPEPVERDTSVPQVEIKSDTRKLRNAPSLNSEVYDELCKRGIYNVQRWETADGYDWALIAINNDDPYWVAVMAGEDLPVIKNYEELYNLEKAKVEALDKANKELTSTNKTLSKDNKELKTKNEELAKVNEDLTKKNNELDVTVKDLEKANKNLEEVKEKTFAELALAQADLAILTAKLQQIRELAEVK